MTYPPQGPYGQQPDPYGQQQQPQYGGGYQQQQPTGQYGGYDPNAQYGGGYQQYGQQYGGFGGPQPPKRNKGPIIAVIAIVVLLLGGLGITGFVAPCFFLSDDKADNADSGNNTGGGGDKDSGAEDFLNTLVAAADDKDKDALEGMQCSDATEDVKGATRSIDEIDSAKLVEFDETSDTEAVANLVIKVDGDDGDYKVTIVKDGGKWCWQDIKNDGADPTEEESSSAEPTSSDDGPTDLPTGDTEGEQFVQTFLDKLNAGDGAGAAAMSCPDSTSQSDITEAGTQSPQLEMDPAGTTADETYVGADLKGTLNGETASGRTSAFLEDGGWCIYTFFAS